MHHQHASPLLPLSSPPLLAANQVSNAPDEWEEEHTLRHMADVLHHPATSQYVWLLLPKGSAPAVLSWYRDAVHRSPPTAAERQQAVVLLQRQYRARAAAREARAAGAWRPRPSGTAAPPRSGRMGRQMF